MEELQKEATVAVTESGNTELVNQLVEKLNEGTVKFKYTKADGEVREAIGTKNMDLIPEIAKTFKNDTLEPDSKQPAHLLIYYDFDAQNWRRFKRDSLIEIVD